jgi:hypothetical protein
MVISQQTSLTGPHVFANPFAFVLTVTATSLLWPVRGTTGGERAARWRSVITWAVSTSSAAIVTLALLGGWNVPFVSAERVSSEPMMLVLATLLFLVKSWLIILAARWFAASHLAERRRDVRLADTPFVRTFFLLFGAASTVGFHILVIDLEVRIAGHMVAVALFVTFASALSIVSIKEALRGFLKPENTKRTQALRQSRPSEAI